MPRLPVFARSALLPTRRRRRLASPSLRPSPWLSWMSSPGVRAANYLRCSVLACMFKPDSFFPPTDDQTDMKALEASVRGIEKDGLVWGASKLVPVGYGVNKLQISLVVEDEKISLQDLEEEIAEFEDYVQSTDIVSSQPRSIWMSMMLTVPTPRLLCRSCELPMRAGLLE